MSSEPATSLIERNYARMQITIDDDGVHLSLYAVDENGQAIINPNTKQAGVSISLTHEESVHLGDNWAGLRFETPFKDNDNKVILPKADQHITCSICFGSAKLNNSDCSYCDGKGYVSSSDDVDTSIRAGSMCRELLTIKGLRR